MFSSIVNKMIMAVSGAVLGVFILGHLAGNATIFLGGQAFLAYAGHLHSLGPLLTVVEFSLLFFFVLHVFFGIFLYLENLQARPERYAVKKGDGGRSLGSMSMPYTGVIILLFLAVHLWTLSFGGEVVSILELLKRNLGQPTMAAFYIVGLLALTLHISHGFWSMFQTFGVNHPRYDGFIRKSTLLIALVAGVIYVIIPGLIYFKGIPN